MMIDAAVHHCFRCSPDSDPVGLGMHVESAARMRAAHLDEEREVKAATDPIWSTPDSQPVRVRNFMPTDLPNRRPGGLTTRSVFLDEVEVCG
jgi:hypothetical protein